MSQLKLQRLTVENYRSLRNVSVERLGRLNLITGQNNVGKTSLLEAVRLWASRTDISALLEIIDARDESAMPDRGLNVDRRDENSLQGCLYLFSDYPSIDNICNPIKISSGECSLTVSIPAKESFSGFTPVESLEGLQTSRYLELRTDNPEQTVRVGLPSYYRARFSNHLTGRGNGNRSQAYPFVFLSSKTMDSIGSYESAVLWDNVSLTNKEEAVLQGLRIIEKDVLGVGFVEGGERKGRIPVVRLSGVGRPVPLRGLGDGVIRLFEIMLALANAEDGFLLVDDFENGLHYSIQETAWRTVLELSQALNVQVFATTHSDDCVSAFQQVAEATGEDMAVIRLLKDDGMVRAETLDSEKLSLRLDLGQEVR